MSSASGVATRRVRILNAKGLHARPAAAVSRAAQGYDAAVTLSHGSETADARSIMDLLLLVAVPGSEVEIRAEGADADAAVEAVAQLFNDGFGELNPPG